VSLYHGAAGIDHLERLARGDSPVHRLHPGAKLAVTVVYIVVLISFPPRNVSGLAAFLLYPAALTPLSGTRWRSLLARLSAALPFALLGGISNLFLFRETAFYLGHFAVSAGLVSFVSILLKTAFSVFAVLLLIATTPLTDISRQLVRMGLPKIIALQFVMTYRYIGTLIHEAAAMFTAYTLRSPGAGGIVLRDMGSFLGQLMLRSFDRAERIYAAMKCRGFDGVYRGAALRPFGPLDCAYAAAMSAAVVFLRFFNLSRFFGKLLEQIG
jgi:cobalt/nickel transport system permease protein